MLSSYNQRFLQCKDTNKRAQSKKRKQSFLFRALPDGGRENENGVGRDENGYRRNENGFSASKTLHLPAENRSAYGEAATGRA
jgi:hypothetical protein